MSSLSASGFASLERVVGPWRRPHLGAGALVNVLSITFAVAALAHIADPEVLLDGLWVTLAVGAFFFTVVIALVRIAIGAAFALRVMAADADPETLGVPVELLDLAEWPILLAISIIVTLMAHRMSTTAKRYAALYRHASDRLLSAQEIERGRLSQDLHDSVGQTLTAVLLTLDAADGDLPQGPDSTERVRIAIRKAHELAVSALEETRDVAVQLRPPRISEVGLGSALRDLAMHAGLPVEVRFDPAILPAGLLPDGQEIAIYRVVQEALGNAARHAHATRIWIDAAVTDRSIRLGVVDDGVGFDTRAPTPRGMGLAGMRERAGVLDGTLSVRSRAGIGTTVRLTVPLVPRPRSRSVPAPAPKAGR
jgi:signal transduction histidine kinase